ncbi:MAG TPA: HD domain-containing phosphohydrolase [Dehalococcoidia bacterium]|nr:HD domain-containing phosphohydrolase [Dehalococcoidia bacterium]
MRPSTSHIHARFAIASLLICAGVAVLAVLAGRNLTVDAQERAAASAAAHTVAEPLQAALLAEDGERDLGARLDDVVSPLLGGAVTGVRVSARDGVPLYARGIVPQRDGSGGEDIAWSRFETADGEMFVSRTMAGGFVVEVVQDARPIDERIANEQRTLVATTAVAALLLYVALQGAFWFVARGIVRDHARLLRLYHAGAELRSSLDLHDVLTRLVRDVTTTAKGQYGLVALFEAETGDILLRTTYEATSGATTDEQRVVEEWFLRRCIITNTAIMTAQATSAYEHVFGPGFCADGQVHVLCVPMSLRERVVGVVAALRPATSRRSGFAADDVRQAVDLAAQSAMAIEQAQLFAKVRSYANEVEVSYDSTLKALMAALDAKDEVTEGHCERVAKLTVQLARQMGVKEPALVDIERGALLHDVGKIGVPDAVLRKPDALDDGEWEAMRRHPLLAGVMISKVGFLEGATPILLYHHERYDGEGYPFRLSREQIPLEARIFSVVDAYDAMTSDRPYRPAMTHEAALAELRANSGTQFDPQVVVAFEDMMERRPELRMRAGGRREGAHERDDDERHYQHDHVA